MSNKDSQDPKIESKDFETFLQSDDALSKRYAQENKSEQLPADLDQAILAKTDQQALKTNNIKKTHQPKKNVWMHFPWLSAVASITLIILMFQYGEQASTNIESTDFTPINPRAMDINNSGVEVSLLEHQNITDKNRDLNNKLDKTNTIKSNSTDVNNNAIKSPNKKTKKHLVDSSITHNSKDSAESGTDLEEQSKFTINSQAKISSGGHLTKENKEAFESVSIAALSTRNQKNIEDEQTLKTQQLTKRKQLTNNSNKIAISSAPASLEITQTTTDAIKLKSKPITKPKSSTIVLAQAKPVLTSDSQKLHLKDDEKNKNDNKISEASCISAYFQEYYQQQQQANQWLNDELIKVLPEYAKITEHEFKLSQQALNDQRQLVRALAIIEHQRLNTNKHYSQWLPEMNNKLKRILCRYNDRSCQAVIRYSVPTQSLSTEKEPNINDYQNKRKILLQSLDYQAFTDNISSYTPPKCN